MQMTFLYRREAKINRENHHHEKVVDNTYEARLKRLKEELNGPTVTEIIEMHKNQTFNNNNKGNDNVLDETPAEVQKNVTSPSFNPDTIAQSFEHNR